MGEKDLLEQYHIHNVIAPFHLFCYILDADNQLCDNGGNLNAKLQLGMLFFHSFSRSEAN